LYERVEEKLGVAGHAIPRDDVKRHELSARLLGKDPADFCRVKDQPVPGVDDISNPFLIGYTKVEPVFPERARRQRQTDQVILQVIIYEDGWVGHIELLRRSQSEIQFFTTASQTVSFWRYRPAMINGCPVPVYSTVFVNFSLH
jgi:TonB family protein